METVKSIYDLAAAAWSFLLFGGVFNRMADLTEEHSLNRLSSKT